MRFRAIGFQACEAQVTQGYLSLTLLVMVWLGLGLSGLDRMTVISIDTPAAQSIVWFVGIVIGGGLTRAWFRQNGNGLRASALGELKRNRRSLWFCCGLAYALLGAAAGSWTTGRLVGVAAQHIGGIDGEILGTVSSIRHVKTARSLCSTHVLIESPGVDKFSFCIKTLHGDAIGPTDFRVHDAVRVQMKKTLLGSVAVGMQRDRMP